MYESLHVAFKMYIHYTFFTFIFAVVYYRRRLQLVHCTDDCNRPTGVLVIVPYMKNNMETAFCLKTVNNCQQATCELVTDIAY